VGLVVALGKWGDGPEKGGFLDFYGAVAGFL